MEDAKRIAIITGANRGIGLSIAKTLDAQGYRIAACIRSQSDALDHLIAQGNGRHKSFPMDLANPGAIQSGAREALSWAKHPTALINCGAMAMGSLFAMTRMADIEKIYQVNLFGPLQLAQYVTKKMMRAKSGSIVNIASTAGLLSDSGTLGYGGTKAALIHATRVMATELGPFGIRVNAIAPSVVETDMAYLMDDNARAKLDDRSALAGEIFPEDIANVAAFLASDASSKITGQVIRVDRGMPF